jgi:hypothetical protein
LEVKKQILYEDPQHVLKPPLYEKSLSEFMAIGQFDV